MLLIEITLAMEQEKEVSTDEAVVEQDGEQSEDTSADASEDTEDTGKENNAAYWRNKFYKSERLKKEATPDGDVVKKSDLEKAQERLAIQHLEGDTAHKDVVDNWDDVMKHYVPRRGRTTKEDIIEDILDASAVWKRTYTPKEKPEGEIAAVHGTGGKSPEGTPTERKRLIPKSKDISEWYS